MNIISPFSSAFSALQPQDEFFWALQTENNFQTVEQKRLSKFWPDFICLHSPRTASYNFLSPSVSDAESR